MCRLNARVTALFAIAAVFSLLLMGEKGISTPTSGSSDSKFVERIEKKQAALQRMENVINGILVMRKNVDKIMQEKQYTNTSRSEKDIDALLIKNGDPEHINRLEKSLGAVIKDSVKEASNLHYNSVAPAINATLLPENMIEKNKENKR